MLYLLEIENFASVKETQVLDLRIGGKVPEDEERFAEIYPGAGVYVPKVVAIFGANASGKTNVLRALEFVLMMAGNIPGQEFARCSPFLGTEGASPVARVAIEFGGRLGEDQFGLYRYELSVEAKAGKELRVVHEVMRVKPHGQSKWQRVFERNEDREVKGSAYFRVQGYQHLVQAIRPEKTVLATFEYFQHEDAWRVSAFARHAMTLIQSLGLKEEDAIHDVLSQMPDAVGEIGRQLMRVDLGLRGIRYANTPEGPRPMFQHAGLAQELPWGMESNGTRSFVRLFPFLKMAFEKGGLCVVDEMDSTLHPMVVSEVVRWFHDPVEKNPKNSQLWFTGHNATVLQDLTKEEVVLCEKDSEGRTRVYSLMDVKARRDDNLFRKYMSGVYGGVPVIG